MNSERQYEEQVQAWRLDMEQNLRAENSWLALVGLFWLREGKQSLGKSERNDVRLTSESTPGDLGQFTLDGQRLHFQPNPTVKILINGEPAQQKWLNLDTDPDPDFITVGELRVVAIGRGDRIGLRVWDNSRAERESFPGRIWYPIQPDLRLNAEFTPADPDHKISIPNVLEQSTEERVVGELTFEHSGQTLRLQALEASNQNAFVPFSDRTNGDTTYPGGRFLVVELTDPDGVSIDFNRAYNPPCAFTPHATCPLPPEVNQLPIRIEAGERFESLLGHQSRPNQ